MNRRGWLVIAGILTIGAGFVYAWSSATKERRKPDIILISIDTLRPDHLGCYGYARPTSPNIDQFRRDAVLFETTIAAAPSTLPSHASLFTSLPSQHHGASHTKGIPLAPSLVTITEVLRNAGYETAAIVGGAQLAPEFGLTQGFDTYDVAENGTFEQVAGRALERIARRGRNPLFLFLHTYQVHHPYTPNPHDLATIEPHTRSQLPPAIDKNLLVSINAGLVHAGPEDRRHIVAAYDAEIVGMDRGMGNLMAGLKRRDLYDDVLVIFTSDHGEEFGERGFMGWHSHTLFEELLRVPLLVKFPDRRHAGRTIGGVMRSVDIAPMILETAGLPRHEQFQRFSLATALARGRARAAPVLLWRESAPEDRAQHEGLRSGTWKLINDQLYDLAADPEERRNVRPARPGIAQALDSELRALVRARRPPGAKSITPSPETIESLRGLGYIR